MLDPIIHSADIQYLLTQAEGCNECTTPVPEKVAHDDTAEVNHNTSSVS